MKTQLLFFLIMAVFLSACNQELLTEGDYFFLRSEGAEMPVWVKGNKRSNVFILFLHGGPGGTAHEYIKAPAFKRLEQDYALVYWDQRASGLSQGNPAPEANTLAQFVTDLDKVVELLRQRYGQPTIFLMGHSWGGAIATSYLSDVRRQAKIKGWIHVDGSHNERRAVQLSRQFVADYGIKAIAEGRDVTFWQKELAWYQERPVLSRADSDHHYYLLDKANGNVYRPDADSSKIPYTQFIFASPFSLAYLKNGGKALEKLRYDFFELDLTPQMGRITLPTLILWGLHDGNEPVPLAYEAYASIGTPDADKQVYIFNESAHSPHEEEPHQFASQVTEFVNRYK
jgi:pimeloyl-ACP methyl ester carboxylesterase